MNNCIGKKNYKSFFSLIFFLIIISGMTLCIQIYLFFDFCLIEVYEYIICYILGIYSLAFFLILIPFFSFHIRLVVRNITSYEAYYISSKLISKYFNYFSYSKFRNFYNLLIRINRSSMINENN